MPCARFTWSHLCCRSAPPANAWSKPPASGCASPFEKPNTVLILKADSLVRLRHLDVEREELFCIFLCIDEPQDLIHNLAAH